MQNPKPNPTRRILLFLLVMVLVLPAGAAAHRVKSVTLTLEDTDVAKCEYVTARVRVCIQVQREDLQRDASGRITGGQAQVPVRLVYDEWGGDSDYEGSEGDIGAVCEKTFTFNFLPENVGADICRSFFLCSFHASTYDYGWTTDPDFYACAKSSLNSAPNKYSGQVEVEFGDTAGSQTESASIAPSGSGHVAVAVATDLPPLMAAGFTVSFDEASTSVLAVDPHPAFTADEILPGTWRLSLHDPDLAFLGRGESLVSFTTEVDASVLPVDQQERGGASVVLSEVEFLDTFGEILDPFETLAFGDDQDADGLPVALEDDIDGDGVHDDFDAFPLEPDEVDDADGDWMGDVFETFYFGGLGAEPEADEDGDGVSNRDEFWAGTDPTAPDTDNDGVGDGGDPFPVDGGFSSDRDGDGVADPLDRFPDLSEDALDADEDGLGDDWERFWFGGLRGVTVAGDADGDGLTNIDEFYADSNPIEVPLAPSSSIHTGEGAVDALLYPLTIDDRPFIAKRFVGRAGHRVAVEFGFAEHADPTTIEAYWNGVSLYGVDGRRQTGDEPFGVKFDVARQGFEMRISGLPISGQGDVLEVRIASALDPSQVDSDVIDFPGPPTCSYGEEDFIGGLNGHCTANADGTFHLFFEDWSGNHVLSFDWPADLDNPPPADCDLLCEAGALEVAYSTDRLNLNRDATAAQPIAPPFGLKVCRLAPNANEEYDKCDGSGGFRCFLACGLGCVGCEVKTGADCSAGGKTCIEHIFKCYKRPCCVAHDLCLAAAPNVAAKIACHIAAGLSGCGLQDAKGNTHTYNDATCFDPPKQCIEVPRPGNTQACCLENEIGMGCQDLAADECYEAGGVPQGPGTRCSGADGVSGTSDDPCR